VNIEVTKKKKKKKRTNVLHIVHILRFGFLGGLRDASQCCIVKKAKINYCFRGKKESLMFVGYDLTFHDNSRFELSRKTTVLY